MQILISGICKKCDIFLKQTFIQYGEQTLVIDIYLN